MVLSNGQLLFYKDKSSDVSFFLITAFLCNKFLEAYKFTSFKVISCCINRGGAIYTVKIDNINYKLILFIEEAFWSTEIIPKYFLQMK